MYQIDQILLEARWIGLTVALHISKLIQIHVLVLVTTPSNCATIDKIEGMKMG